MKSLLALLHLALTPTLPNPAEAEMPVRVADLGADELSTALAAVRKDLILKLEELVAEAQGRKLYLQRDHIFTALIIGPGPQGRPPRARLPARSGRKLGTWTLPRTFRPV